jgi:hypothetical protein
VEETIRNEGEVQAGVEEAGVALALTQAVEVEAEAVVQLEAIALEEEEEEEGATVQQALKVDRQSEVEVAVVPVVKTPEVVDLLEEVLVVLLELEVALLPHSYLLPILLHMSTADWPALISS